MKIVILNQKGGVGKSTVTVNLGYGLASAGKQTLVIDLDPQAHSSSIYSPHTPKNETVNELFRDKNFNITRVIRKALEIHEVDDEHKTSEISNLFIIPSNIHLAATSELMSFRTHREKILHNHLKRVEKDYHYVLIDCPPTLGFLTLNAVYTADLILIPTSYSKYSLDGISDLFTSIAEVKETDNYNYRILRNIKDARSKRTNEVIEEQLASFKDHLFQTIIRRCEAINQSQMVNQPIFVFDPRSTGAEDFTALTQEIMNHG